MLNLKDAKILVHPAVHIHDEKCGCLTIAKELGINWPSLPFKCPECDHEFKEHSHTVAVVNPKAIDVARKTLEQATKVVATGENNGRPVQASELARLRFAKAAAEGVLANPAAFACSMCLVEGVQARTSPAGFILDLLSSSRDA